ncbi:hypothetical protein L1987_01211 [Smallanthus sonchifolius]|uniref:Uncharacterized protein n=1 Tax=Smallanthus sonchifolius TaxID=185202 RepID=A0ACB9K4K1_9ASTR|nr:hypothetical protein L1987_01211 [Smallanthus sonchifolius]
MPILYYGLVVVATAVIVLAIYNLIIVRWCATQYQLSHEANQLSHHRRTTRNNIMSSQPPPTLSRGGSTIGKKSRDMQQLSQVSPISGTSLKFSTILCSRIERITSRDQSTSAAVESSGSNESI